MKKITFTICITLICSLFIIANGQSQEEMQKWMEYMTPSEMHQMLAKADGKWNEEITMWADADAPPQTMNSSCVNKMILGGRYQESISSGSFNGMPFEGKSVSGWDNARKVFVSTWIDNFGTGIIYMEGPWNAKTKTIEMKGNMTEPMSGKSVQIRETMQFIDDDTHLMRQ